MPRHSVGPRQVHYAGHDFRGPTDVVRDFEGSLQVGFPALGEENLHNIYVEDGNLSVHSCAVKTSRLISPDAHAFL